MSFYKMDPAAWDFGTAKLTLEQEAAYLRIVNAIHTHCGPIPNVDRVLAGMFRCSTRKARALLAALEAAEKITISDGMISNKRASSDLVEHRDGGLWSPALDRWRACQQRGGIPTRVKEEVWQRDGTTCRYCGDTEGPHELDHVMPWSRGGKHTTENLVVACRSCNRMKRDSTPEEMGWTL